jgi:hypothetical protein
MDAMTIDDATKAEKARLLAEGFGSWNRRDVRAYTNAVERFGALSARPLPAVRPRAWHVRLH